MAADNPLAPNKQVDSKAAADYIREQTTPGLKFPVSVVSGGGSDEAKKKTTEQLVQQTPKQFTTEGGGTITTTSPGLIERLQAAGATGKDVGGQAASYIKFQLGNSTQYIREGHQKASELYREYQQNQAAQAAQRQQQPREAPMSVPRESGPPATQTTQLGPLLEQARGPASHVPQIGGNGEIEVNDTELQFVDTVGHGLEDALRLREQKARGPEFVFPSDLQSFTLGGPLGASIIQSGKNFIENPIGYKAEESKQITLGTIETGIALATPQRTIPALFTGPAQLATNPDARSSFLSEVATKPLTFATESYLTGKVGDFFLRRIVKLKGPDTIELSVKPTVPEGYKINELTPRLPPEPVPKDVVIGLQETVVRTAKGEQFSFEATKAEVTTPVTGQQTLLGFFGKSAKSVHTFSESELFARGSATMVKQGNVYTGELRYATNGPVGKVTQLVFTIEKGSDGSGLVFTSKGTTGGKEIVFGTQTTIPKDSVYIYGLETQEAGESISSKTISKMTKPTKKSPFSSVAGSELTSAGKKTESVAFSGQRTSLGSKTVDKSSIELFRTKAVVSSRPFDPAIGSGRKLISITEESATRSIIQPEFTSSVPVVTKTLTTREIIDYYYRGKTPKEFNVLRSDLARGVKDSDVGKGFTLQKPSNVGKIPQAPNNPDVGFRNLFNKETERPVQDVISSPISKEEAEHALSSGIKSLLVKDVESLPTKTSMPSGPKGVNMRPQNPVSIQNTQKQRIPSFAKGSAISVFSSIKSEDIEKAIRLGNAPIMKASRQSIPSNTLYQKGGTTFSSSIYKSKQEMLNDVAQKTATTQALIQKQKTETATKLKTDIATGLEKKQDIATITLTKPLSSQEKKTVQDSIVTTLTTTTTISALRSSQSSLLKQRQDTDTGSPPKLGLGLLSRLEPNPTTIPGIFPFPIGSAESKGPARGYPRNIRRKNLGSTFTIPRADLLSGYQTEQAKLRAGKVPFFTNPSRTPQNVRAFKRAVRENPFTTRFPTAEQQRGTLHKFKSKRGGLFK